MRCRQLKWAHYCYLRVHKTSTATELGENSSCRGCFRPIGYKELQWAQSTLKRNKWHKVEIYALSEVLSNHMFQFYKRKDKQNLTGLFCTCLSFPPPIKCSAQPLFLSFLGSIRDCLPHNGWDSPKQSWVYGYTWKSSENRHVVKYPPVFSFSYVTDNHL